MNNSVIDYLDRASQNFGDKTAYIDEENQISFSEVALLSSRVAVEIIGMGLFQQPVLVLTERNVFAPVTYLGIAKAGCYYIPIDATLNIKRINQIIDISCSKLVITNRSLKHLIEELDYHGNIIILEEAFETDKDLSICNDVCTKLFSSMPLYVIFTSGSTGKPKGVITSHLSLMNYIEAVNDVLQLTKKDVLGNQSPLDYIAAIRDIYLPLYTGATTVIIPKNEFAMAAELAHTLDTFKITVLCWSAAGLEMSAKIGLFEELKTKEIRKVLFSGSILPGKVLKEWQRFFPEAQFINQYGPTEATASCTYYVVKEQAEENTVLPIGIPYRNYGIIILNEDGTETAPGNIGEICVTGLGVTLGYYGDQELSGKSFIQNPLNNRFREIIYKTGDLGKYDSNGLLLFFGRKDRQIKHLGHRIELDEIELTAKKIENIDECVAVYDEVKSILYLVYSGEAEKKSVILYFRKTLPSFMAPRKVVKVASIPHLPNGKIDIKSVKELTKRSV